MDHSKDIKRKGFKFHSLSFFQNNEARIPEGGFALLSTTSQNAALAHFITALTFDPYQELLWTGNNMVICFR